MSRKIDACEYCQSRLEKAERRITVYWHRRDKHFIFEQVPARVCSGCGERYFSAGVVQAMETQMRSRRQRATVPVPVIALRAVG